MARNGTQRHETVEDVWPAEGQIIEEYINAYTE